MNCVESLSFIGVLICVDGQVVYLCVNETVLSLGVSTVRRDLLNKNLTGSIPPSIGVLSAITFLSAVLCCFQLISRGSDSPLLVALQESGRQSVDWRNSINNYKSDCT